VDDLNHHLLRKLRLRHFELLGHLGEVATVHAAAKRMHLTQPAVSRMIQIEEIFGGPLFDRTARGISANHIGLALMRRSGMLVAELAAAQQEATVMRAGASGCCASAPSRALPHCRRASSSYDDACRMSSFRSVKRM
jgi:DNA-binding transcriptional LysR family regulator